MGLFCVSFHFRTDDEKSLSQPLAKRRVRNCRVLPAKNGWVSLYEEAASQQDDARIRKLAGQLSGDLKSPAIAFMVHDSDIACYWLFDAGQLLDEFNSCPGYFDGEESAPTGGNAEVLARYCRPGVKADDLAEIFGSESLFAEAIVEKLARALGIDPDRALADYRDEGGGPDDESDEYNGDDNDPAGGSNAERIRGILAGRLTKAFGAGTPQAPADPKVQALVDAAVVGDLAEIDRVIADGAAINGIALAALNGGETLQGLGLVPAASIPKIAMTPLLAAVAHKQHPAAKRLLDHGADPNHAHPMFGTAIQAATGAGDVETVQLLIERGADVNARNARGQSSLDILAAAHATQERLVQVQAMMKSMGTPLPAIFEKLSAKPLPVDGWNECEKLLRTAGAK